MKRRRLMLGTRFRVPDMEFDSIRNESPQKQNEPAELILNRLVEAHETYPQITPISQIR